MNSVGSLIYASIILFCTFAFTTDCSWGAFCNIAQRCPIVVLLLTASIVLFVSVFHQCNLTFELAEAFRIDLSDYATLDTI